jgi:hypothetical protein
MVIAPARTGSDSNNNKIVVFYFIAYLNNGQYVRRHGV